MYYIVIILLSLTFPKTIPRHPVNPADLPPSARETGGWEGAGENCSSHDRFRPQAKAGLAEVFRRSAESERQNIFENKLDMS